jgi:hypothetical protein
MDPAALRELPICRGYIQVIHQRADGSDEWFDLDGKAGSIRVVTHPSDGNEIEFPFKENKAMRREESPLETKWSDQNGPQKEPRRHPPGCRPQCCAQRAAPLYRAEP